MGNKKPASALAKTGYHHALAVYLTCPQAEIQIGTARYYSLFIFITTPSFIYS